MKWVKILRLLREKKKLREKGEKSAFVLLSPFPKHMEKSTVIS